MTQNTADGDKSCGPQPLPDGEPTNEWGLSALNTYAQIQYRQIIDGEKLLAPAYWRLGHALVLTKKAFKHGKWSQHLKDLGIDKTRASKARAIHRTFDNEKDVTGLTVEEAYAQRQRKQAVAPEGQDDDSALLNEDGKRLRRSIATISTRTDKTLDDAAFAEPREAVILIPAVRKAIQRLQNLLDYLEERATHAQADASAQHKDSEKPPEATS